MANKMIRQHEPLRVPQGWNGQDRALVIQLERILTDLYRLNGEVKDIIEQLDVPGLSEDVAQLQQDISNLGTASEADVYNDLDKNAEGFVLDARQGKLLNDSKVSFVSVSLSANTQKTITLANSSRLVCFYMANGIKGMSIAISTSTGTVTNEVVGTLSGVSFDVATSNALKVTATANVNMFILVFLGSVTA